MSVNTVDELFSTTMRNDAIILPMERKFNIVLAYQRNLTLDAFSEGGCDKYAVLVLPTLLPVTGFLYRAYSTPSGVTVTEALITNIVPQSLAEIDVRFSDGRIYSATLFFKLRRDGVRLKVDEKLIGWKRIYALGDCVFPEGVQYRLRDREDVGRMYSLDSATLARVREEREERRLKKGVWNSGGEEVLDWDEESISETIEECKLLS